MQQSQRDQPRSVRDQAKAEPKDHPVFRLYIRGMVDSSGFPSASEMENATKGLKGYNYATDDSPLVARVKYLHKPVADLLAQREIEWASRKMPEKVSEVKDVLKMKITKYLMDTNPEGVTEEEIRHAVENLISESESEVFRNVGSGGAE